MGGGVEKKNPPSDADLEVEIEFETGSRRHGHWNDTWLIRKQRSGRVCGQVSGMGKKLKSRAVFVVPRSKTVFRDLLCEVRERRSLGRGNV